MHFTYLRNDKAIYDAFWDSNSNSWHLQKVNSGGLTNDPAGLSSPFGCVFQHQQHIGYLDASGNIWDCWYDGSGHWNVQRINGGAGGRTSGPAALLGNPPCIWVDQTSTQQHFTYLDNNRAIFDAFWDNNSKSWHLETLKAPGGGGLADHSFDPPFSAAGSSPHYCYWERGKVRCLPFREEATGKIWSLLYDTTESSWASVVLPGLASGNAMPWIDSSGDQLHITWREGPSGVVISPEARVGRVIPPPNKGIIWDNFFTVADAGGGAGGDQGGQDGGDDDGGDGTGDEGDVGC